MDELNKWHRQNYKRLCLIGGSAVIGHNMCYTKFNDILILLSLIIDMYVFLVFYFYKYFFIS